MAKKPNKPTPLTIEELMSAQQNIVETSTDPDLQKKAMESLTKLGKIKGDSQNVSLGDVRTEIKGLRQDLKQASQREGSGKPSIPLPADQGEAEPNKGRGRGHKGTLGDAWQALKGKRTILKEGYSYDENNKIRDDATGDKVFKKTAALSPLAGAASVMGSLIGEKTNKFVESKRSEGFQNFMDANIRATKVSPEEPAAVKPTTPVTPLAATAEPVKPATSTVVEPATVKPVTPAALYEDSGSIDKSDALTTTSMGKLLDNLAKKLIEGGVGGSGSGGDSITDSLTDMIPDKKGRPSAKGSSKMSSKGGRLARVGNVLKSGASKVGNVLKSGATRVAPYAASAAIMYGVGRGIDAGAGALGVGKDAEGNDLKFDEKADDTNWNKMNMFQKAESGIARGVETVGSYVVPNMANEAKSKRIKAENEYFANQDKAKVTPLATAAKASGPITPINVSSGASGFPITAPETAANKVSTGAVGFPLTAPANVTGKPTKAATVVAKQTAAGKADYSKDYTQDPRYKEILAKEKDITMGGKIRRGVDENGMLTVKETVAAEREAKQQYMEKIGSLSGKNAAAKESGSKPIIISQPTPARAPAAPAPIIQAARGAVRPSESAMERYADRSSHFY